MIIITYQILTEHHTRFRKWASTKANAILNNLEVVFWLAALVITGLGIGRASGAAAALSALVLIIAIALEYVELPGELGSSDSMELTCCDGRFLSIWMAGCSIKVHRPAKSTARYNMAAATAPIYAQAKPKGYSCPSPVM